MFDGRCTVDFRDVSSDVEDLSENSWIVICKEYLLSCWRLNMKDLMPYVDEKGEPIWL